MKQILTHKARSIADVIEMLKNGQTFSCPTLPHYRYGQTKSARNALLKAGMLRQTGRCCTSIQYVASDLFKLWMEEHASGKTTSMPIKWAKLKKKEAA